MAALKQTLHKPQRGTPRRNSFDHAYCGWSLVGTLPIKFKETVTVEFHRRGKTDETRPVTFESGQIVDDLIVTDFDDFSAILEFRDGWIAYGVPKSYFVAAPNF